MIFPASNHVCPWILNWGFPISAWTVVAAANANVAIRILLLMEFGPLEKMPPKSLLMKWTKVNNIRIEGKGISPGTIPKKNSRKLIFAKGMFRVNRPD
jgi:hypothetical protein